MSSRNLGLRVGWVLLALGLASPLDAEPYLAVRTGLKCGQCHVNRTGGGGRNAFGNAWAQTQLPVRTAAIRSRSLNDWVAVGLDLRTLGAWNADLGPGLEGAIPRTTLEITDAQIQLEARLIDNALAFYVDQTVAPDRVVAREAFAMYERLPLEGYIKAGKFLLPYGWRIWDNAAFIREETGFTYFTPDLGVEVGIEPGPFSWFVALTNGSVGGPEGNSEKMLTSSAVITFPRFRVGASASHNSGAGLTTNIVGGYAGVALGPLVVLGEVDAVFDSFDDPGEDDRDEIMAFVEGTYLIHKGVNVKVSHGFHDPTVSLRSDVLPLTEDQRARTRVGIEAFPISFVQISAFYTRLDNAGESDDVDQVSLELHLHF
jgi:hypothetical protein